MAGLKIDRTTLDLQVKIRDCWVLVGPYPLCTQTSAATTGIFEGGVGNPTSISLKNDRGTMKVVRDTFQNHNITDTYLYEPSYH
jgi:hypothetical protein